MKAVAASVDVAFPVALFAVVNCWKFCPETAAVMEALLSVQLVFSQIDYDMQLAADLDLC